MLSLPQCYELNELKQLVLMEDFKNSLPEVVSTLIYEHKTMDVFKVAFWWWKSILSYQYF